MKQRQVFQGALCLTLACLLAACGGGRVAEEEASAKPVAQKGAPPPQSAAATSQGMVGYVATMATSGETNAPPVNLSSFTPPPTADAATASPTVNDKH